MHDHLSWISGHRVLARGGVGFDPASLPGLAARYDLSDPANLFQDGAGTIPAATGQPVGRVSDLSGNGHHLTQAASASRPTIRTVAGRRSVYGSGTQWLDVPASLSLDRRNSTLFVVHRVRSPVTTALWHMPAGFPNYRITLDQTDGGELQFFHGGLLSSGIARSHGIAAAAAVGRSGEIKLFLGRESRGGLAAAEAGSSAGGYLGNSAGNFQIVGHLYAALAYGRALGDEEIARVLAWLAAKYGAVGPEEPSFILFEGDSITQGVGGAPEEDYSAPAQFAARCARQPKWMNLGTGGDTIQNMAANTAATIGHLAKNAAYPNRIARLLIGHNDLNQERTAAQVKADIDAWIAAVRAGHAGVILAGCTILPSGLLMGAKEAARIEVNAHIRDVADFDFATDLAADPRLADPGDAAIYGDGIHPTNAGYAIVAQLEHAAFAARGYVAA
jgi:lysophospholipase L1-like esterase